MPEETYLEHVPGGGFQEVKGPHRWFSEQQQARYAREALDRSIRAAASGSASVLSEYRRVGTRGHGTITYLGMCESVRQDNYAVYNMSKYGEANYKEA
jgi:hypothetical protein